MKKQIAILIATGAVAFGASAATVHVNPPVVNVGVPGVVVTQPAVARGNNGLHLGQRKAHVNRGHHYGQYKNAGKGKRMGAGNGRGKHR